MKQNIGGKWEGYRLCCCRSCDTNETNQCKKRNDQIIYAADKKLYLYYAVDLLGGFNLLPTEDYLLDIMLKMREHYNQHLKYRFDTAVENENYAILINSFSNVSLELNNFISLKTKNELVVPPKKIYFVSMKEIER